MIVLMGPAVVQAFGIVASHTRPNGVQPGGLVLQRVWRQLSHGKFQRGQQEHVFPLPLVDPVSEVAVKGHTQN